MIQEIELVFYRDGESGKPCLGMVDKQSGEVRNVIIEDIISDSLTGDGPVPVLVTYDRQISGVDMEEAYKLSFKVLRNKQTILLEDKSGRRGRFIRKLNSISFPYAIALNRDGEEFPMSYSIDGNCSSGKKEDRIVRMILLSQDGSEEVLKGDAPDVADDKDRKEEKDNGPHVDSSDFPEPYEE